MSAEEADDLLGKVGHVTLGFCWPGSQAPAVAEAYILDVAEEFIVAAHGLVVGLEPSMPHAYPKEVAFNAEASMVPHMSADVAATRSGSFPELLIVKTTEPLLTIIVWVTWFDPSG